VQGPEGKEDLSFPEILYSAKTFSEKSSKMFTMHEKYSENTQNFRKFYKGIMEHEQSK
jgi:hypothetical protein